MPLKTALESGAQPDSTPSLPILIPKAQRRRATFQEIHSLHSVSGAVAMALYKTIYSLLSGGPYTHDGHRHSLQ